LVPLRVGINSHLFARKITYGTTMSLFHMTIFRLVTAPASISKMMHSSFKCSANWIEQVR